MRFWVDALFKLIDAVLAFLLLGMVVMVFGNVLLRYAFNSGIQVSEELSRFFFIWMVFIGAVVALREGKHLGVDTVVLRLSHRGKCVAAALCQCMILLCCAVMFWGAWQQHDINATAAAPVTGLAMVWIFGLAYVVSLAVAAIALRTLVRIVSGRATDAELLAVADSGDELEIDPKAEPAANGRLAP